MMYKEHQLIGAVSATTVGFKYKPIVIGIAVLLLLFMATIWYCRRAEGPLIQAQALIHAGKAAAALPILEKFSQDHPENSQVFTLLAQGYLSCDRLGEGRTALDTALKLRLPAEKVVPVVLSYVDYYVGREDFEEAEKLFASVQNGTGNKDLNEGKAKLYLKWADSDAMLGKLEQAANHLSPALALSAELNEPLKSIIPHRLAERYRQLAALAETKKRNDREAAGLLLRSLKAADEPATRMALANIYCRQGKLDQALDCYFNLKQSDPNNLEARHRLIDLLIEKRDYSMAQGELIDLTSKERSEDNYQLLVSIDLKLGNFAGAVKALEDARKLHPKDVSLLRQLEQILITWAVELARQGRMQESISARGHAARISEMLALIEKKQMAEGENQGSLSAIAGQEQFGSRQEPPIALTKSRIWLAKGSLTPEGEIAIKNTSGLTITDLALTVMFYDNTRHKRNGSIDLPVTGPNYSAFRTGSVRALYFSCPNTVHADDQLAVIIFWHGRLLKELPVVKQLR